MKDANKPAHATPRKPSDQFCTLAPAPHGLYRSEKTKTMKTHHTKTLAVCLSSAVVLLLTFLGGTKFAEIRPPSEREAPIATSNDTAGDSDIITELKDDGTRIVWIRAVDGRILNQYKFDSDGTLALRATYRIDASGSPLTCKITDGQKTELFKVSYGYRKSDGMLVEERIFDSRLKRLNDQGSELPVRRILHVEDTADGEPKRELIELVTIDFPQELEGGFSNPFQKN